MHVWESDEQLELVCVRGGVHFPPYVRGFEPVMLVPGKKWNALSTHELRNEKGEILENIWRFSKLRISIPPFSYHIENKEMEFYWKSEDYDHFSNIGGKNYHENFLQWREKGIKPHVFCMNQQIRKPDLYIVTLTRKKIKTFDHARDLLKLEEGR